MYPLNFSSKELQYLKKAHKQSKNRRQADRIKAIILYSKNWNTSQIAEALLLDKDTIRNYRSHFEEGGMNQLLKNNYQGKSPKLNFNELQSLESWVETTKPMICSEVCQYVLSTYGIFYTTNAMSCL